MTNNSKYIFLVIEERNGEYEYKHRSVHKLIDSKTSKVNKLIRNYLKSFYGGKAEKADGGYYFFGGEVFVKFDSRCFISEEIFNILMRYL